MKKADKNSEKIVIVAEKREIFGKKLHLLRKEDKVPANIFGKDFASTAVTVGKKEAMQTFRLAGETQVIYMQLDKTEVPVLISNLHLDPVSDAILHVDFKKVNLLVKTEAEVPVILVGEPIAVEKKKGDLLTLVDTLTVEALPADMPSEIEVDVTGLAEIDDAIHVSDIKINAKFTIRDEADTIVAKIAEHKEEDLEPDVPEGDEVAEGETPAEGAPTDGEAAPDGASEEPAKEEKS